MKKIWKKTAAILLAAVLVFGVAPIGARSEKTAGTLSIQASAAAFSGKCGANVNWTLDTSTGVLSVTGTGEMTDYAYDSQKPWGNQSAAVKTITIGDGVQHIGSHAFQECSKLVSLTIGDGVESIGEYAFADCTSLAAVTIPARVNSIGEGVFYGCTSLTAITVDGNNPAYCSDANGVLYNKAKTTLVQYPAGDARASFAIPNGVTEIANAAFYDCASLTAVTIPDSVTRIGEHAFHNCANLVSVTMGKSVTSIGAFAFYGCESLTAMTIPDSVTEIGLFAFCGCTSLASLTLGCGVTHIGSGAFYGCTSLAEVEYRGSEQNRQKITIDGRNDLLTQAEWQYTDPDIRIIRGNPDDRHKEYAYRSTVTFTAEVSDGADVQWYVDGQPAGNDVKLTVKNAKKNYTVTVVVTSSGGMQTSDEEHVSIKTDFWSKIVWFFTHILFPARFTVEQ